MQKPVHINRKPLYAAIIGSVFAVSTSSVVIADAVNPAAVQNPLILAATTACNPCAAKKNPCNPCNPCAVKKVSNPCNPCAAKKNPCNPCNPCALKKNPCNPCNPCATKKNPCKTS
jgi:hypothetical protein